MRIFAPGFGAGAVAGFVVMRVDPAVVNCDPQPSVSDGKTAGNGKTSLAGRVALVTGAVRGIGKAIALEMARRGASVAINFLTDDEAAEAVAKEFRKLGVGAIVVQGDVANNEDAQKIVAAVLDKWQRIDVLVNNAGISNEKSLQKMTDEDWQQVIETNLNGTFNTTRSGVAGDDQPALRTHYQRDFRGRPGWGLRTGELLRQQGRHHRLHQDGGTGVGQAQHHGQHHCPGISRRSR